MGERGATMPSCREWAHIPDLWPWSPSPHLLASATYRPFGWLTVPPFLGVKVFLTSQPEACPAKSTSQATALSLITQYPRPSEVAFIYL